MWTVSNGDTTWVVSTPIAPDPNNKFKAKLTYPLQECSGFEAAVSKDTYPEALPDRVGNIPAAYLSQIHWRRRMFALVDAVRDGELDTPILREQDDQMDTVLAVVDADEGELYAHLLHRGEVNTSVPDNFTFKP